MGPEKRAGHCSHGNGKPLKGLSRRCSYVHTRLPTPALWPNPSACPVTSVDLGGKQCQAPSTRDARGRNQESLFRNNTPTTTFWGAHDSTGKLGETLALLMEGNQRRKVANGPLHGSESQWPTPGHSADSVQICLIKPPSYLQACFSLLYCFIVHDIASLPVKNSGFPPKAVCICHLKRATFGTHNHCLPQGLGSLTRDPQPWRCSQLATFNNLLRW